MKPWVKQEIVIAGGAKVMAQKPLIVSASRSTDVPAFYSDWFVDLIPARIYATIVAQNIAIDYLRKAHSLTCCL